MKIGYTEQDLKAYVLKKLRINGSSVHQIKILKEGLDSRKHDDIHYVINLGVFVSGKGESSDDQRKLENEILKNARLLNDKNIMLTNPVSYVFPHIVNMEIREFLDEAEEYRPVVIGAGPAGYFAAVKLAEAGFKPIVLERGKPVEERTEDIKLFWEKAVLDPDSNVCFGEGGAGTFSDGKLNTGNKDKEGYFAEVLRTFVKYGAPEETAYKSKPHIGTDVLRGIMRNMRQAILKYGGDVRFQSKLIDIEYDIDMSTFGYESELPTYELQVEAKDETYSIFTHTVILAIGHSARDTIEMLKKRQFTLSPKPFAMGVRVEHKQEMINKAMYGEDYRERYGDKLPAADYKLVYHTDDQTSGAEDKEGKRASGSRSVFSFCMCPGGYVVNSSTEDGALTINGMSYSGRDGENANSAIVVGIEPEDYLKSDAMKSDAGPADACDPMAGIRFQQEIERAAYKAGGGRIPLQLYGDLKKDVPSTEIRSVRPSIKGSWAFGELKYVFPDFILKSIMEAFSYFGRRIAGYDDPDTVLTAVEARTSSPVRIDRDDNMMAADFYGVFPIGEGAGYAGGITSAAADGIKCAERVSEYLIEDLIETYKVYETSKYL